MSIITRNRPEIVFHEHLFLLFLELANFVRIIDNVWDTLETMFYEGLVGGMGVLDDGEEDTSLGTASLGTRVLPTCC